MRGWNRRCRVSVQGREIICAEVFWCNWKNDGISPRRIASTHAAAWSSSFLQYIIIVREYKPLFRQSAVTANTPISDSQQSYLYTNRYIISTPHFLRLLHQSSSTSHTPNVYIHVLLCVCVCAGVHAFILQ